MNNYQDYVIKDGKLIGDFEGMYQNCPDPWHMKDPNYSEKWARKQVVDCLLHREMRDVIEAGSGIGSLSAMIHAAGINVKGFDVSPTAVAQASSMHKDIVFVCKKAEEVTNWLPTPGYTRNRQAIIFPGITWYLIPHLEKILECLVQTANGCWFIHKQNYNKAQRYGVELFHDANSFNKLVSKYGMKLVEHHELLYGEVTECVSVFYI